ncbi:MAG TPA: hypothetical protein VHZ51_10270 [Ktedonobacteraceae bacterium]|jgi:hypothetical protein|nr:hypothetical protein [Ktedonobacteraceae bacterium]
MSGRIAHRPHYRSNPLFFQRQFFSAQKFLPKRWAYHHQQSSVEKHALGYRLSLLPMPYRRMHDIMLRA